MVVIHLGVLIAIAYNSICIINREYEFFGGKGDKQRDIYFLQYFCGIIDNLLIYRAVAFKCTDSKNAGYWK